MLFNRTKQTAKNAKSSTKLVKVFNALGDRTRFKLLTILSQNDEICVSELASEVGISNAGVSQQLKVLEHAGLVKRNRMGQKICYQINESDDVSSKLMSMIND